MQPLSAWQGSPVSTAQAVLSHKLDHSRHWVKRSTEQEKIKATTLAKASGGRGLGNSSRCGAAGFPSARRSHRSCQWRTEMAGSQGCAGNSHPLQHRLALSPLHYGQPDPVEHSASPSGNTRPQARALPCLTCTWPPAFMSAILLLSIGPGGSVRGEQTRQKPFYFPCCQQIQLICRGSYFCPALGDLWAVRVAGVWALVTPARHGAHRGRAPSRQTCFHSASRPQQTRRPLASYRYPSPWQRLPTHETTACWYSRWHLETPLPGKPCSAGRAEENRDMQEGFSHSWDLEEPLLVPARQPCQVSKNPL